MMVGESSVAVAVPLAGQLLFAVSSVPCQAAHEIDDGGCRPRSDSSRQPCQFGVSRRRIPILNADCGWPATHQLLNFRTFVEDGFGAKRLTALAHSANGSCLDHRQRRAVV